VRRKSSHCPPLTSLYPGSETGFGRRELEGFAVADLIGHSEVSLEIE
jgi:hypothetical protein